jgi:hypothetical protein
MSEKKGGGGEERESSLVGGRGFEHSFLWITYNYTAAKL